MQTSLQSNASQDILALYDARVAKHQQFNKKTENCYQSLSYFERQEMIGWLQENFENIPVLDKTKKTGLEEILLGQIGSNSALLLIRHALKNLKQVEFC